MTTATVTATNESPYTVYAAVELADFTSPDFAIQDTDCMDTLASSASCTTTVAFTPHHVGGSSGTPAFGGTGVSLAGVGQVALTISPTARDFQTMYSDVDSDPFAFTIQNMTAVAQHPTTALRNTLDSDGFAITGSTCTDIPALGSCAITVVMRAGQDGVGRAAILDVDGADASLTGAIGKGTARVLDADRPKPMAGRRSPRLPTISRRRHIRPINAISIKAAKRTCRLRQDELHARPDTRGRHITCYSTIGMSLVAATGGSANTRHAVGDRNRAWPGASNVVAMPALSARAAIPVRRYVDRLRGRRRRTCPLIRA